MTDANLRIRDLIIRRLESEIDREPCESRRACLEQELHAIKQLDLREEEENDS